MKYNSYKSTMDLITESGKNSGVSRTQCLQIALDHYASNLGSESPFQTINFSIMACEHGFNQSKKNIVFIENQSTIDNLLNLKFSAKLATVGYIPFKTFMVSLPKNAKAGDTSMYPCLVTIDEPEEFKDTMDSLMSSELGMSQNTIDKFFLDSPQRPEDLEPNLRIIIPVKQGQGISHIFAGVALSKIPLILNTPVSKFNKELYLDLIGVATSDSYALDEDDIQLQLKTLRMVIAMFIYNKVTDNKHFRNGVPKGTLSPKYLDLSKNLGNKCIKHVFSKSADSKDKGKVGVHVRSEHIRQYTDERFYKGEHSKTPIGERFTLVKETLVGEGKAHTQEFGK